MTYSLTPRQSDLLRFIEGCGAVSPSFREMQAATGASSLCIVHADLAALERHGRIRRLPNRARAIEVLQPAKPIVRTSPPARVIRLPLWGKINLNENPVRK